MNVAGVITLVLLSNMGPLQAPSPQNPPPQQVVLSQIPSSPGVTQPNYVLGPGDSVRITVWTGNEILEHALTLAADGTVLIPFFVNKLMPVAGMSALQLRDSLLTELKAVFRNPVVQVVAVGFESKRASLLGEVTNPGQFVVFGNTRILDFILQHGGLGPKANLTEIQITRRDGEKVKINLLDIVMKGDQSQNAIVDVNDIVFVPSLETIGNKYFMLGEVRNPGLLFSQEELSLLEAIARSGSLTTAAQTKHVFVVRLDPQGSSNIMDIPFEEIYKIGDASRNIPLKSGDIIYVPRNLRTRISDVLSAVGPVLTFVRDAAFLGEIITRTR